MRFPSFEFIASDSGDSDIYSYGFVSTSGELDDSVAAVKDVLPHLLELAQMEKSAQLIAEEIEQTPGAVSTRWNMCRSPTLQETIKYITMKLDENERGNSDPSDEGQGYDAQGIDRAKARDQHQYPQRLKKAWRIFRQAFLPLRGIPSTYPPFAGKSCTRMCNFFQKIFLGGWSIFSSCVLPVKPLPLQTKKRGALWAPLFLLTL